MAWIKKGFIYKPDSKFSWCFSHAQVPFGFPLNQESIRIYFATRDILNRSVISFIEVDSENLSNIKYVHNQPCLKLGELGTHDESGVMPSCFVVNGNDIFLYYTGWNIGGNVSYRTSIGLAISTDGGITFKKISDGPILDRSIYDPCFSCQPFVLKYEGIWKMWYLSCLKWQIIDNYPEPFYNVKYAESSDGIDWIRKGKISLDLDVDIDAIGNPTIIYDNEIYSMYFSHRKATNYRNNPKNSYKIGLAESKSGIEFVYVDKNVQMKGKIEQWESIMNAYPHVFKHNGKYIMLYNGNGFGQSGFGYSILENE